MLPEESFRERGYYAPLRVLSEADASELRGRLEKFEVAYGNPETGKLEGNLRFRLHVLLPWVSDLVHHPRVVEMVKKILGPDVLCWSTDFNIKETQSDGYFSWHQDSTYAGLEPCDAVTVWIALSTSNTRSGCVQFVPGTHHTQLPHTENMDDRSNMLALGQEVVMEIDHSKVVPAELRPGEASIHHFRTVHASGPNRSADRRIGFAIRYMGGHVKKLGTLKECATLVSGCDKYDHFTLEPRPVEEMGKNELQVHQKSMKIETANYFAGRDNGSFK